jgi:hypothetical protein
MVARLAHWFANSVEPLAATWLKSEITSIHDVGSYYCRIGIDDFSKWRNEHAKGNAIDISGFTTATGTTITVGRAWGPTLRGLLAAPVPAGTAAGASLAETAHEGSAAIREARLAEAARRGIVLPQPATPEGIFLHAVHESACSVFGTVLGPEANNDLNEHFHLDLAARPGSSYCE